MKSETGYAHPAYAAALAELGRPRLLPQSGGWILERQVPGTDWRDAMGCYPIFACRDWTLLKDDLERISNELLSLVVVTDPLGAYSAELLRDAFKTLAVPFKEHFVVELDRELESFVDPHHQRNALKGRRDVEVARAANAGDWLEEWCRLYAELGKRHSIRGFAAFSRASFEKQLRVPGLNLFYAKRAGEIVGITLWFVAGEQAYYHLAAYDAVGYGFRASFALFWRALRHFRDTGVRLVTLGAGAGAAVKAQDGLTRFKKGWATRTGTAYLCGRIFDPERYAALTGDRGLTDNYFPAYRSTEFP